jgi:hypothetical protein
MNVQFTITPVFPCKVVAKKAALMSLTIRLWFTMSGHPLNLGMLMKSLMIWALVLAGACGTAAAAP